MAGVDQKDFLRHFQPYYTTNKAAQAGKAVHPTLDSEMSNLTQAIAIDAFNRYSVTFSGTGSVGLFGGQAAINADDDDNYDSWEVFNVNGASGSPYKGTWMLPWTLHPFADSIEVIGIFAVNITPGIPSFRFKTNQLISATGFAAQTSDPVDAPVSTPPPQGPTVWNDEMVRLHTAVMRIENLTPSTDRRIALSFERKVKSLDNWFTGLNIRTPTKIYSLTISEYIAEPGP